jgi:hypothetical protein
MEVDELRRLLIENKFEELFHQFFKLISESRSEDLTLKLTLIQSRYNDLKNRQLQGVIRDSEYDLGLNKIRNSLLDIIERAGSKQTQEVSKPRPRVNYRIILLLVWIFVGVGALTYSLFPAKDLVVEKLEISCSGSSVKLNLATGWKHEGSLHSNRVEVDNIVLKNETTAPQNFSVEGGIEVKPIIINDTTDILFGAEKDFLIISRIDALKGRLYIDPGSRLSLSGIKNIDPLTFFTEEDIPADASIILQLDDPVEFDDILVQEIEFYSFQNNRRKSLIKNGEIKILGIPSVKYQNLSSRFVKFSSQQGVRLRMSFKKDKLTFSALNVTEIDQLWIDHLKANKQITPSRLMVWYAKNQVSVLLAAFVWSILLLIFLFFPFVKK